MKKGDANRRDSRETARISLGKVMWRKGGFGKSGECPNCKSRDVYREHKDKSLYCWTCSERWADDRTEERGTEKAARVMEERREHQRALGQGLGAVRLVKRGGVA